jgi:hypothetical protein
MVAETLEIQVGDLVQQLQALLRRSLGSDLRQVLMHRHGGPSIGAIMLTGFNDSLLKPAQMQSVRNVTQRRCVTAHSRSARKPD